MTLTEFNNLDLNKKYDLVWEWGHYLTSRRTDNYNVVLFLVNDFFAEVQITISDNKTSHVNGIAKNELPKEYLDLINPNDPFVQAILSGNKSSSRPKEA